MKILFVLAILISLSSAYLDFSRTDIVANTTQIYGFTPTATGTCSLTLSYVESTTTVSGTVDCTGVNNVTAIHLHNCGTTDLIYCSAPTNVLGDIPINFVGTFPISFSAKLDKQDSIKAICENRVYLNVHTADDYTQVRANIVDMVGICNIKDYKGDGKIHKWGDDPKKEDTQTIKIGSFCIRKFSDAPATGVEGSIYFELCWDYLEQELYISGVASALKADVSEIYLSYPFDGSYFAYISSYNFPSDAPFAFTYSPSEFQAYKVASPITYFSVDTDLVTDAFKVELKPADDSDNFPLPDFGCYPDTNLDYSDTAISCYTGYDSTGYDLTECSQGQVCATQEYYKSCVDPAYLYCYSCACDSDLDTDLSSGYLCCDSSSCNLLGLKGLQAAICVFGSSSMIAGGLLVTIFFALISLWIN
jgi:hypothetical protein